MTTSDNEWCDSNGGSDNGRSSFVHTDGDTAPDTTGINGLSAGPAAEALRPTSFPLSTHDESGFLDSSGVVPTGKPGRQVMTSNICSSNRSADAQTPHSQDLIQLAAAQLLDLGAGEPSVTTSMMGPGPSPTHLRDLIPPLSSVDNDTSPTVDTGISPESLFADDGIFLPGSTYFELHSALRNHIFDTARSACPSLWPSPYLRPSDVEPMPETNAQGISDTPAMPSNQQPEQTFRSSDNNTPAIIELSKQEEFALWKNWVEEIAPWVRLSSSMTQIKPDFILNLILFTQLDKFDRDCHFQQKLPALANIHPHLRSSMLALSARQLERKHPERSSSDSLALYQEAVHQLLPQLQTKLTDVVASCVVLCVLEMMSCE